MPDKTNILNVTTLAKTKMFTIEQVDLKFANGQTRSFERLKSGPRRSVMIAAVDDNNNVLLVKEYAAGTGRYELGLPKGLVESDETIFAGANRELQEEVGFIAEKIIEITQMTLAPNYMSHKSYLVLATGLSPSKLEGDEPEPLEIVTCSINKINEMIFSQQISEARSIAGLYIIRDYLHDLQSSRTS